MQTGEIYAEAGDEIDASSCIEVAGRRRASKSIDVLDIDHITIGAYMRNTLAASIRTSVRDGCAVRHLPGDASGRAADG
jgi:DNA-directed RNA polymerase subunit beta